MVRNDVNLFLTENTKNVNIKYNSLTLLVVRLLQITHRSRHGTHIKLTNIILNITWTTLLHVHVQKEKTAKLQGQIHTCTVKHIQT